MKAALWSRFGAQPEGTLPKRLAAPAGLALLALVAAAYMVCAPPPPQAAAGDPQEPPPAPVTESQAAAVAEGLDSAAEQVRLDRARSALQRREQELEQRELERQAAAAARDAQQPFGPATMPLVGYGPPVAAARDPRELLEEEFALQRLRRLEAGLSAPPVAASTRRPAAAQPPEIPDAPGASFPPADFGPSAAGVPSALEPDSAPAAPPPSPERAALAGVPSATPRPDPGPGWEVADEGTVLDAVLVTQIRGDFPGPAVAMVASPLWSRDRQRVLVPRGTRALGAAAPVSGFGQARLAIAFRRLILPGGERVELQFDGLDQAGATGLQDKVNRHYLSTFGTAGALGVLAGLTQSGSRGPTAFEASDPRWAAGQRIGQSSQAVFERYLNRPPTLTIRAGHRLRIHFTSDVALPRQPPRP